MNLLEKFIGKKVRFEVSLADTMVYGGSVPAKFIGILEQCNSDMCYFTDVKYIYDNSFHESKYKCKNYSNNVVINTKYLIMVSEVDN